MSRRVWVVWLMTVWLLASLLAACGGAAPPAGESDGVASEGESVPTEAPAEEPAEEPAAEEPLPEPESTAPAPPEPMLEARVVELEWPPAMRLGDSGLIRLSLVPDGESYVVTTEFEDHQTMTDSLTIAQRPGYDLSGVAVLEAIEFDYAPSGEQLLPLEPGQPATWRWTITPRQSGQHRLFVTLDLRWTPQSGQNGPIQERQLWSRGLTMQVSSLMGMTTRQATTTGLLGLAVGGGLTLPVLLTLARPRRSLLQMISPNPSLVLEPNPAFQLSAPERALLSALFGSYGRLALNAEFRSGYSGARIFLALPIRPDGRADAHTIVKIGDRVAIEREYRNYENFVKHTLPPLTARIQDPPVVAAPRRRRDDDAAGELAAVRYTFLGEEGHRPTSLREQLLADGDPAPLYRLFETFGPNWWMQRRPYSFRLGQEYDRALPSHFVLEPVPGRGAASLLDGRMAPGSITLTRGDVVEVRHMSVVDRGAGKDHLSLLGEAAPGQPPLRVRWLSRSAPSSGRARVVATRLTILRSATEGFELFDLPDPIALLPALLGEMVQGTRSTIHGDLNLENILVGTGGFVWLIDFAETREGHPLADFAHLGAELIAHVIAPRQPSAKKYLAELAADGLPLLSALRDIASRCLLNPSRPDEFHLALALACLGALKFPNLDRHARQLLYLTGAYLLRDRRSPSL